MRYCSTCGNQLEDHVRFCPKCGSPIANNINQKKKPSTLPKTVGCIIAIIIAFVCVTIVSAFVLLSNVFDNISNDAKYSPAPKDTEQNVSADTVSGKDYELEVWQVFWEDASEFFGVEYSDYIVWDTVTNYICDYTTHGGQTAHYYLIRTAFKTNNEYGIEVTRQVSSRCYIVPDYSNIVYITYITLDDETVYYDEDTEFWLMDMNGGGIAPPIS